MMRGFRVPFDGRALVGDVLAGEESPRLLVLHGAGQSNRERFRQIREHFLVSGIGSVAFDCTGHGETGGDLKKSSLQSRTAQACAVIEASSMPQPFSILAGSMGGYTAVTLLRRYVIANLILVVPAMYAPRRTRSRSTPGSPRSSGARRAGNPRMAGSCCLDLQSDCFSWPASATG
jgi:alpha-beta hydrolase superfamily lysophospholipase